MNVEPPNWVLKKIEEIYPKARLGNYGGRGYALCELWRVREDSVIGSEFDGHVYGSRYDRAFYRARHITDVPIEAVFSGAVFGMIKNMLGDFKARQIEKLQAAGAAEDYELQQIAEEQGRDLYKVAHRSYHRPQVVAKKFQSAEDKAVLSGEAAAAIDIKNSYMPTPGVGASIK